MNKNHSVTSWPAFDLQLFAELCALVVLLLLSLYVVYFSTQTVAKLYFLLLLCLFLVTKKDYFWFAFFFIIIAQPGWLFSDFSIGSTTRIPLYTFLPSTSLTPMDLFTVLVLLKALFYGRKWCIRLRQPLTYILVYGIFLLVLSIGLYGADLNSMANTLRGTFMYSVILSFMFLVDDRDKIYRFMHLVFPIVFFILYTQIYFVISGDEFVNALSTGQRQLAYTETGMIRPVMGGVMLVFFAFIFSLFLLQNNRTRLEKGYLYVVVVTSYLSVFISATRIWVIMFSVMLAGYFVFVKRSVRGFVPIATILTLLFILLVNVTPLKSRLMDSWLRISRLSSVVQGRFYADTSFDQRYSVRLPHVLEGLKQDWFFGSGFSDAYMYYNDGHVGNFNMLLQVGVLGFFLFAYLWYSYFKMIRNTTRNTALSRVGRNSLLILGIAFTAMLVAHFSTYQFFGLTGSESGIYFISIFLGLSEFAVRQVKSAVS